jgi:glutathione S-transferase
MITVHGRKTSSNVQALLWGLEEMGLAYERIDRGGRFGGLDAPDYLALNPHGRIPTVEVGGQALWETGAILRYFAGQCGESGFWPAEGLARARVDMWADWAKNEVALLFTRPVFWQAVRVPEARRDPVALQAAVTAFEAQLAKAEARLAVQAHLAGEDFSLADVMLGHVLYRYFDIEIARAEMPALRAYAGRLAERPAYRKTVMVSYDILRNTL